MSILIKYKNDLGISSGKFAQKGPCNLRGSDLDILQQKSLVSANIVIF